MLPLFHFSEDPAIEVFRPQVAPTSIDREPCVWAVDETHAPSYWFPRDCPRACCWQGESSAGEARTMLLGLGGARRMHAVELGWLQRMRDCRLYAYRLDPASFKLHDGSAGYWVSTEPVIPLSIELVGDLLERHVDAAIELRFVENLWPLIDMIASSGLEFSVIRKANARQRDETPQVRFFK